MASLAAQSDAVYVICVNKCSLSPLLDCLAVCKNPPGRVVMPPTYPFEPLPTPVPSTL